MEEAKHKHTMLALKGKLFMPHFPLPFPPLPPHTCASSVTLLSDILLFQRTLPGNKSWLTRYITPRACSSPASSAMNWAFSERTVSRMTTICFTLSPCLPSLLASDAAWVKRLTVQCSQQFQCQEVCSNYGRMSHKHRNVFSFSQDEGWVKIFPAWV